MKASQLIESLTIFVKKYGDLDLIYSIDDEGSKFRFINQEVASECMFNGLTNEADFDYDGKPNAFCVN